MGKFVVVYFDEILFFSHSKEGSISHLHQGLEVTPINQLTLQLKKCSFMVYSVNFLGYMVSTDGICVDPTKVSAIVDWPVPTTLTHIQCFHGLASFYRKFIYKFSTTMAHITSLMKNRSFVW